MRTKRYSVLLIGVFIFSGIISCETDDPEVSLVPDRDRAEQQAADKDSLLAYFETHYYNSQFLSETVNAKVEDIEIIELAEGETVPDGYTLLSETGVLEVRTTTFQDTEYEYYFLNLNQGGGDNAPKFTDRVAFVYEGSLVEDGSVFDSVLNTSDPSDENLVGFGGGSGQLIVGWQRVLPEFNPAADFTISGNGDVNYNNYGLGVMFLPSGLAYFSSSLLGIPSYSNLVFKFALLQAEQNDHDNDGIPSYIEDLDGDLDVFDDDTDENAFPNYLDIDDDGDGVLTRDEVIQNVYEEDPVSMMPFMSREAAQNYFDTNLADDEIFIGIASENDGTFTLSTLTIPDSNSDDKPDYLDENITINYNEDE